jgi:hypothetical protein
VEEFAAQPEEITNFFFDLVARQLNLADKSNFHCRMPSTGKKFLKWLLSCSSKN